MRVLVTATGAAKIGRFIAAMRAEALVQVEQAALALKPGVMSATPSADEEARLLSRGFGGSGVRGQAPTVGVFGTPEGGRFLREGGMVSLRTAIQQEPIGTGRQGDIVVAGFGDPERINAITGFSWQTRSRGVQGPTYPFNFAYVQAMENGGVVWDVVPRPGTKALEPEPGRFAFRMAKTLAPMRMFSGTLFMRRGEIATRVLAGLQRAAKALS